MDDFNETRRCFVVRRRLERSINNNKLVLTNKINEFHSIQLSSFKFQTRDLKINGNLQFTQQEYENILQNNRDLDLLNQTWTKMQEIYNNKQEKYKNILELVKKAAEIHGLL